MKEENILFLTRGSKAPNMLIGSFEIKIGGLMVAILLVAALQIFIHHLYITLLTSM